MAETQNPCTISIQHESWHPCFFQFLTKTATEKSYPGAAHTHVAYIKEYYPKTELSMLRLMHLILSLHCHQITNNS